MTGNKWFSPSISFYVKGRGHFCTSIFEYYLEYAPNGYNIYFIDHMQRG